MHLGCITLASIHRVSLDTTSKAVAKVFHRDARVMQLNTSYHSRHATKHMVQCWNNAFFKLSCHLFCLCCHFSILDFEKFSSRMPEKKIETRLDLLVNIPNIKFLQFSYFDVGVLDY